MYAGTVVQELIQALVPESDREFNCEYFEGEHERVVEAVQKLRTFSMLPGPKHRMSFRILKYFRGGGAPLLFFKKAEDALDKEDITRAAGYLARGTGASGARLRGLRPGQSRENLRFRRSLPKMKAGWKPLPPMRSILNIAVPCTRVTGLLEGLLSFRRETI